MQKKFTQKENRLFTCRKQSHEGWQVQKIVFPECQISSCTEPEILLPLRDITYTFFAISWQTSKLISEVTKPRRTMCDTAMKNFFTRLFFTWVKNILNFWKSQTFCSCEKKGVKNFFLEKYELSAFNAVLHVSLRALMILKRFIEFWTFFKSEAVFQKWKNRINPCWNVYKSSFLFSKNYSFGKQISNRCSGMTKPRRDTCDMALKSWRYILFDEKVFYHLFYMSKKLLFQKTK